MLPIRALVAACGAALIVQFVPGAALADTPERLSEAAETIHSLGQAPDSDIPQDLLSKARCIVVVPALKSGAFVVGAKYGRGFASCRTDEGWSAPAAVRVEGGSVGFQIGGKETDVVMLVMNRKGMDGLLSTKFTLGGDASVAAGPVGRTATANTDAAMTAEILSYSRTRGIFAGVALDGATLRADEDANVDMYGKKLTNCEILTGVPGVPPVAEPFISALRRFPVEAEAARSR
jgi:lipid-binding SYLF domain-containing protein